MVFAKISGHERVKKILERAFIKGRIPSAYLFIGPDSEAMAMMAVEFVKMANCGDAAGPCGKCESCEKIERGVHPDVLAVSPEGSSIKIEQIREITAFTRFGPTLGKLKAVIVDHADYMTTEAYTSFLKTLEEATGGVIFILATSKGDGIPDTVASRCQKVIFPEAVRSEGIAQEDRAFFSDMLEKIRKTDEGGLIDMWADIPGTEDLKAMLTKLMLFLWTGMREEKAAASLPRACKVVSECYRALERKVNQRLALDVMMLDLKEVLYGG